MANRNFANGGKLYAMHVKPVLVDCNFVVDATSPSGITSLKGPLVKSVFMASSAPAGGNPDPANGIIVVKLQDNYARLLSAFSTVTSPLSGTGLTAVVAGVTYVITDLGTATLADFVAVGYPVGFKLAVGAAFVATASATIGGAAEVQAIATTGSDIDHVELIGNSNVMLANVAQPTNGGGQIIFGAFKNSALAAPVDGSLISLTMYFDDSSVRIGNE